MATRFSSFPLCAVGFVALLMGGCADGRVATLAPSFDEAALPAEVTLAGDASLLVEVSSCPEGYKPIAAKPGDPVDQNGNGIVCWDGRSTVDDSVSTCPEGFKPIPTKPGDPVDENGNGIVCWDGSSTVDDSIKDEGQGNGLATGHGNFFDKGGKGLQDISFSFHGKQTGRGGEAKGEFEHHDQTNPGPDLTVHGDVLCLSVFRNTASFIGQVTRSNDPGLPVGQFVAWFAIDNGEGANEPADQVTRLLPIKLDPRAPCQTGFKLPAAIDIVSGNIQVH